MPAGIPVATVAVNNAANAGLLAVRILGASDPDLRQKMIEYQSELEVQVLAKASRLENDGWALYLGGMGESR
jgi:phosphoribosylcarboxyaminoimidazole (NCAIR) mutase